MNVRAMERLLTGQRCPHSPIACTHKSTLSGDPHPEVLRHVLQPASDERTLGRHRQHESGRTGSRRESLYCPRRCELW
jgi:hypothetical protein